MTPSASPFLLQASPSYQMRVEAMYIILAIAPLVVLFPWGTISSPSSVSSFFFLKVPLLPSPLLSLSPRLVVCIFHLDFWMLLTLWSSAYSVHSFIFFLLATYFCLLIILQIKYCLNQKLLLALNSYKAGDGLLVKLMIHKKGTHDCLFN